MSKLQGFARDLFKSAQAPVSWLLSAERLRDAAETILRHEQQFEVPYFRAYEAAQQKAVGLAYADGQTEGVATIEAIPPNYPPAQIAICVRDRERLERIDHRWQATLD